MTTPIGTLADEMRQCAEDCQHDGDEPRPTDEHMARMFAAWWKESEGFSELYELPTADYNALACVVGNALASTDTSPMRRVALHAAIGERICTALRARARPIIMRDLMYEYDAVQDSLLSQAYPLMREAAEGLLALTVRGEPA